MSDGFRVDLGALGEQARRIDELAARVRRASEAAQPVDRTAYGVIGQVFATTAGAAADTGSTAVRAMAQRTAEAGIAVGAAAEEYRQVERQNAARFSGGRR